MKWDVVPKQFRNNGYSSGLEYPFLYGENPRRGTRGGGDFMVWHRHTGLIVFVTAAGENPCLARHDAGKEADRLNLLNGSKPFDYDSLP
jgi:hypothetical protein